ncbi:MAG: hypothetical protein K1X53_10215 [Candidatus Sumerlaeaceae bacterium]|nr:hypothetical protein [Candidatus Sumerlaeaceae bacterium]
MPQKRLARPNSPERKHLVKLLEIYGCLLTEKQLEFSTRHWVKGETLAAIAADHKVTRQAIHETIFHVKRIVADYDDKLKLSRHTGGGVGNETRDRIEKLRQRIASQGIIYSVDWIVRELGLILEEIK